MTDTDQVDWQQPQEMLIPRPTAWPLLTAFGITFILLGLITVWLVIVAGVIMFATSIVGWMGEMLHDGQTHESHG
ncbi:MAG: hypothetical protein P8Z81_00150 [Deinococcales bacterium]